MSPCWPALAAAPRSQQVVEDLYPDAALDLAFVPTYQYHIQADSLLPADAYAAPPPVLPNPTPWPPYAWLPYGPDAAVSSVSRPGLRSPTPSPSPHPQLPRTPQLHHRPRHQGRAQNEQGGASGTSSDGGAGGTNGVKVQFRGPNEIRRPSSHHDTLGEQAVVELEVEVRTCRPEEVDASSSERVTFNSIEEALASIEEQDGLELDRLEEPQPRPGQPGQPGEPWADVGHDHGQDAAPVPGMASQQHDEVVKAAKSLFSKRTRTLYHWLYPDTSKTKLKATVAAAWDTLADNEKQFYLSQVLGRFGLQASSLMINPQLDGIKGLPAPELGPTWSGVTAAAAATVSAARSAGTPSPSRGEVATAAFGQDNRSPTATAAAGMRTSATLRKAQLTPRLTEAQMAVNQLFASCEDSSTWASFSISSESPAHSPTPSSPRPSGSASSASAAWPHSPGGVSVSVGPSTGSRRKRAADLDASRGSTATRPLRADQVGEEVTEPKRKRVRGPRGTACAVSVSLESLEGLEDDAELSSELEKFRQLASGQHCRDEFWRGPPDPDDIFSQLEF